ncbi:hypothetical protein APSETT444_008771 [Aspergillus pseudonomiae]
MHCFKIIPITFLTALATAAAIHSSSDVHVVEGLNHLEDRDSQQVARQAVQNAITAAQMQAEQDAAADAAARPGSNIYLLRAALSPEGSSIWWYFAASDRVPLTGTMLYFMTNNAFYAT